MSTDRAMPEEPALARVIDIETETRVHEGASSTIAATDSGGVQVLVQISDAADAAQVAAATSDAELAALDELAVRNGGGE